MSESEGSGQAGLAQAQGLEVPGVFEEGVPGSDVRDPGTEAEVPGGGDGGVSEVRLRALEQEVAALRLALVYPMHMCVGPERLSEDGGYGGMRTLCRVPMEDACWTRNPGKVTCERCRWENEVRFALEGALTVPRTERIQKIPGF